MKGTSALELWKKTAEHIITFSRSLDEMLGGRGVRVGDVTEGCGEPGAGKTQLCMQLCVMTTAPASRGGLDGDAVYIDTEGSFAKDRVMSMSHALVEHFARSGDGAIDARYTPESILKRIYVCRAHDHTEQLAAVRSLDKLIASNPRIRLVVVDSVAFHFRQGFEKMSVRTRALTAHAQELNALAHTRRVAVVVTNQVTTRLAEGGASYLVPALGEAWAHGITHRIMLAVGRRGVRRASLAKSACLKHGEADFVIVSGGVRDNDDDASNGGAAGDRRAAKRAKRQ